MQTLSCLETWEPLGGGSEWQRCPGRLGLLKELNLKDTGAGCPSVPKVELAKRARPAYLNREHNLEFRKKKRILRTLKEGTGHSGGLQEPLSSCAGGKSAGQKPSWNSV